MAAKFVPSNCNADPVAKALVLVAYATPFVVKPLNPVDIGNPVQLVNVPEVGVPNMGVVMVGLVSVRPATVVAVPPKAILVLPMVTVVLVSELLGMFVNVFELPLMLLLVSVSVVALPTKVSVLVGRVNVPVLLIVLITGDVRVNPATVVVIVPSVRAVDPSVIAVAKLLSNCESGIADVAEPNVYGTAILEPHS